MRWKAIESMPMLTSIRDLSKTLRNKAEKVLTTSERKNIIESVDMKAVVYEVLYACKKCNSENIEVRQANKRTGLYCRDCGAWIQWLTYRETLRMYDHMNKKGLLPSDRAFKRVGRFGIHTIVKCSNCKCQLYNSGAPNPIGQFNLIDALFCPKCGLKFI